MVKFHPVVARRNLNAPPCFNTSGNLFILKKPLSKIQPFKMGGNPLPKNPTMQAFRDLLKNDPNPQRFFNRPDNVHDRMNVVGTTEEKPLTAKEKTARDKRRKDHDSHIDDISIYP